MIDNIVDIIANNWLLLKSKYGKLEIFIGLPYISVLITFWVVGLLFLMLDVYHCPNLLYQYKIQWNRSFQVEGGAFNPPLKKVLKSIIFFQLFILPFAAFLLYNLAVQLGTIDYIFADDIPHIKIIIRDIIIFGLLEEAGFFYGHWLLHQGILYKKIHKIHHEFHVPIAICALYAHPIEQFFVNSIITSLWPVLLGSHMITFSLYGAIAIVVVLYHHSGFNFPNPLHKLDGQPYFHDYHHSSNVGNYGLNGILDYIHGTDKAWRKQLKINEQKKHQ